MRKMMIVALLLLAGCATKKKTLDETMQATEAQTESSASISTDQQAQESNTDVSNGSTQAEENTHSDTSLDFEADSMKLDPATGKVELYGAKGSFIQALNSHKKKNTTKKDSASNQRATSSHVDSIGQQQAKVKTESEHKATSLDQKGERVSSIAMWLSILGVVVVAVILVIRFKLIK